MKYLNRVRAVGRPKKEARDAAIFMARMWRVKCLGDTVAQADKWIIEHWADATPKGEPVGITDPAHVRAAVRRAGKMWLKHCDFLFNAACRMTSNSFHVIDRDNYDWLPLASLGDDFEMDGCAILAVESLTHRNPRACMWMKGMRQVRSLKMAQIHDESRPPAPGPTASDREGVTQVAAGVAEFVGLLQLGKVQRLHQHRDNSRFLRKS